MTTTIQKWGNSQGIRIPKILLDTVHRTKTTGIILCEHIKALDLNSRTYQVVEDLPKDILDKVIDVVYSEIEQIED